MIEKLVKEVIHMSTVQENEIQEQEIITEDTEAEVELNSAEEILSDESH